VIYCRSRAETERLAAELQCGYFHAAAIDNETTVNTWLRDGGLVTATSALGTGVDYPAIVFVLHVGVPYGMIDFAQESGRAGREGQDVDSIILTLVR